MYLVGQPLGCVHNMWNTYILMRYRNRPASVVRGARQGRLGGFGEVSPGERPLWRAPLAGSELMDGGSLASC